MEGCWIYVLSQVGSALLWIVAAVFVVGAILDTRFYGLFALVFIPIGILIGWGALELWP